MSTVGRRFSVATTFSTALVLGVGAVVLCPAGALAYSPPRGPVFNRPAPIGTERQQEAIQTQINDAIDGAPKGSTIRIATYGIDRVDSARKLLRAHRRGVHVQIVINPQRRPEATRMLKAGLGSHIRRDSFIRFCIRGCRGRAASMHAKFYTFSRSGTAKDVVILGSANLTESQISHAWNDSYTLVGNKTIFDAYANVFAEMKLDVLIRHPYRQLTVGRFTNYLFPRPGASREEDPVYQALSDVRCNSAADGAGVHGHTRIRVAMFSILERRGLYLARKLLQLDNAGCDVHVIYGAPSKEVVEELNKSGPNGGVAVRDSRFDDNGDGVSERYDHTKFVLINGAVKGDTSAWLTYTGSENWTSLALHRGDEDMIRIASRHVYNQYTAEFKDIAQHGSRAVTKRLAATVAPIRFGPLQDY
jgi:phosphatidylserine/phosphatidylglycerophosphate/cardiolipin synthase-like enzyme